MVNRQCPRCDSYKVVVGSYAKNLRCEECLEVF